MKRFLLGVSPLFLTVTAFAQDATDRPASGDEAAAAGLMALGCGCYALFLLACVAVWIGCAIWVMKDARRRNSPNRQLVTILTWIPFTTVIGLIVHLVTRPKTFDDSNSTPGS